MRGPYVWQDYVMFAVNVMFCLALLPQVVEGFRLRRGTIHPATAAATGIGLAVMAFCGVTLGLWLASATWMVCAFLWLTLLWQRVDYGKW